MTEAEGETLPLLVKPSRTGGLHHDCSCFSFVVQGLVVLEIVSLLFYVTLLLYSTRLKNIDRNRDAIALFIYVLVVMSYGIFSLQIRFKIGIKILAAIVKAFASSVFFCLFSGTHDSFTGLLLLLLSGHHFHVDQHSPVLTPSASPQSPQYVSESFLTPHNAQ